MNFKIILLLTVISFVQTNASQKITCQYGATPQCAMPLQCGEFCPKNDIQCFTLSCVCDCKRGFVVDPSGSGNCIRRSQCPMGY